MSTFEATDQHGDMLVIGRAGDEFAAAIHPKGGVSNYVSLNRANLLVMQAKIAQLLAQEV